MSQSPASAPPADLQALWNYGDPAGSEERFRALKLASESSEPDAQRWIGSLCNNLGWSLHDVGDFEQALSVFERGARWQAEHQRVQPLIIAKWTVGRALRSLGRLDEALAAQRALAEAIKASGGEADGYGEEGQGECLLVLGRPEEAAPHFAKAATMLADPLADDTERLGRLKRLGGR